MQADRGGRHNGQTRRTDIVQAAIVGGLSYAVLAGGTYVWIRGEGLTSFMAGTTWNPLLYGSYVLVGVIVVGALPAALYRARGLRSPVIGLFVVFAMVVIVTDRSHRTPGPAQDRVHWDVFLLEYWVVLVGWLLVLAAMEAILWPWLLGTVTERTDLDAPTRRDYVRVGGYTLVAGVLTYVLLDLFTDHVDGPRAPDPLCVEDPNAYYDAADFAAFTQLVPADDPSRVRPPYRAAGEVLSHTADVPDEPVEELPESPYAAELRANHRATGMIRGAVPHYAEERVAAWATWGATLAVVEHLDAVVEAWRSVDVSYRFRGNDESPPAQFDLDIADTDWEHPEVIVLTFRIRCRNEDNPRLHGHPGIAFPRFIESAPAAVDADVTMGDERYTASIPVVIEWRYSMVSIARANSR